ncbi:DNA polymerase III subunit beta [Candidatus Woesearchaeota archaeon]|nr:DNA polymerase III subunit beta [Candidatus Woesearchaeota archaeon]
MYFEIDKKDLIDPLKYAVSVSEEKGYVPILNNILIKVETETLHLTCCDSESEIKLKVNLSNPNLDDGGNGSITVNAKKLFHICSSLPANATISFKDDIDKEKLYIQSGRSNFELATLPATDYPASQSLSDETIYKIKSSTLKHQINKVAFAMANGDARYYLNGVCVDFSDDDKISIVATDGHRLGISTGFYETEKEDSDKVNFQCIIPRKAILELGKLLGTLKEEEDIVVTIDSNYINFDINNIKFLSKLIDGQYPNYKAIIPKIGSDDEKIVIAKTDSLKQSLARSMILSNEKVKSILLSLSKDRLIITSKNASQEESVEEVDVDYNGESFKIGFNAKYILDVINVIDVDSVEFHFTNSDSPCLINAKDNDEDKYIVMPIRL